MDMDEKKELARRNDIPLLTKASVLYGDATKTRSLILALPYIGSSIDHLLSEKGQKFLISRIERYLEELGRRLEDVELNQIYDEEGLFDIVQTAYEQVSRARSIRKINRFATLTADYIVNNRDWDETESAIRLIGELSDTHIDILKFALSISESERPWSNLQVFYLGSGKSMQETIPNIRNSFQKYSDAALKLYCSELIAKGLLHDEGIGRLDVRGMEYLVPTELASWLLSKIDELATPN